MKPLNIDLLVDEIVTLPTLPQNIDTVTQIINDPDPSLTELGKAVATDPAFALKTLRLVNSAYYGLRQEVSSVELAVTLLGLKVMKNLVLTAIVCETLRDARELLRHSVATALATRAIAERLRRNAPVDADAAFSFGLLHDIGKIVIVSFLPKEADEIARIREERQLSYYQAEREVIGTDHAELGARLAQRWRLPQRLVSTIEAHHNVNSCTDPVVRQLVGIVAVANCIASEVGFPADTKGSTRIREPEWNASQLKKSDLLPLFDSFVESLETLDEIIGISV